MRSSVRIFALLGGVVAIAAGACSRGSSGQPEGLSVKYVAGSSSEARSWEVRCEKFCSMTTKAPSLEALCATISDASTTILAARAKCVPRKPLGIIVGGNTAVKEAAILDVTTTDVRPTHYVILALETRNGWVAARELGSTQSGAIQLVASRPVDVIGLEPAAFELRIAITQGHETTERLFACGLTGDGSARCPLALVVAKRAAPGRYAAGVAGALATPKEEPWLVDVDLTPQGFIATSVNGDAPSGLVGEHPWKLD